MKLRKILAMLLVVCMVFGTMGTAVFAEDASVAVETAAVSDDILYVSSDYNSNTEGYGVTRFSNYANAYSYATANKKISATIVVEKSNTLSGFTFDNNHKDYPKLAVVIKDGATMGVALSKWDMTYPVTVEAGGTLTCARPKTASVSNIHIKNNLIIGTKGSNKKAHCSFLSDNYQDCDISIRYNGSVTVYNANMTVQDLDAQGKFTAEDSNITVDGAFASATFYATTLTDSTMQINGKEISGGLSDFSGGDNNRLGKVTLNGDSSIEFAKGSTVNVAADVTVNENSTITADALTVNKSKKIIVNGTSSVSAQMLTNNGTIAAASGTTVTAATVNEASTGTVTIDGTPAEFDESGSLVLPHAAVATVDGVPYTDIQAAIVAAAPAGTVTLLDDVTVDKWIMISETLSISGNTIITLDMDGLTIDGNGHTLTVKDVESAGNGNHLFYDGDYNICKLTLVMGANVNGLGITSGSIKNVTFTGGSGISGGAAIHVNDGLVSGVHAGDVTIEGCTFKNNGGAIYSETAQDDLVVKNNTFEVPSGANVIMFRGTEQFINNIVLSGRTVNVVSGSPVVTGNDFGDVRLKVYNEATATIEDNVINVLAFNDESKVNSTFDKNTLSAEAQAVLDAATAPAVTYVAEVNGVGYETVQAAIAAAQDGDTVEIYAGEYDPINISNKNITIKGTVGDNGELLTTIKGGNPAITGHSFNGTIKDIKIVDAFRVMYAEPAGSVTVDNVYVTGATYGLHLVAYSKGLTWTLQNSYMDLSWANSFGVYGDGDAAIIIKGNRFETTNPYYPDYGAIHVNSFLPNVTVEENIFGENAKICIDASVTDTSKLNISKNYHADGVENAFANDTGVAVPIYKYYTGVDENGNLTGLVEISPVAKIGDVEYATLQAAIDAAVDGDVVVLVADIADEDAIVNKALTITADENNKPVLNNVSISAEGEAAVTSLTISNIKFTGDSWINSGVANELTVSNVEADVTPSNTSKTNSRSAFISLGKSEQKMLALIVENCNIVSRGGSDPILGWAAITEANITGNTFGSADSYQTNSDSVKFMGIADGAVINVTDNTVYSNYNGIVFGQNTTRNNAYTANISGNTFYGGADHIWIEVSGSNTVNATINAASNNTINGNAFTASDIKVHPNINTWTSYAGIDVITDADGKVIGGVLSDFAEDKIAERCAALADLNGNYIVGTKPTAEVNNLGMQTVPAGNYMVYGGGSTAEDMPLSFVMQFVADQSEEDMATSPYAEWYGDFVITFTGIEDGSFIADGCYLAGHYGSFGWVKVPVDGMKIEEGERYPVMLGVGMGQKYDYICSSVQDFKCALYLTEDILKTNPNIQVNLELAVVDNSKGEDAAASALVSGENIYKVTDYNYTAEDFVVESYVAQIGDDKYTSLEDAIAAAVAGDTVTVLTDIELSDTLTIPSGKVVILDLNGKTISGVCNASQGHLIMVSYGADLTIKDSSTEQTGKITYAQGTSNVGWTIDVEGDLVLESGTIELTGSWSIGYAVDVRPNAWGKAYTEPTAFVMNGGNIVSSDGAVRVASSSSDTYPDVAASFTMNDGKIDAAWDGVFVQQSNVAWDNLSFTMNDGTIESDLNPVRFYGPAATSYVSGEDCVDIALNGGILTYTGTEEQIWIVDNILRIGGGATADEFLKDATVTASATFAQNNAADGYTWVESDGVYTLEKVKLFSLAQITASLDSSLALNIYYNLSDLTGEGYKAVIEHTKEDGSVVTTTIPYSEWVTSKTMIAVRYTGMAAKQMTDRIKITIYNADGTQASESYETSFRDYAIGSLKQYSKNDAYAKYLPVFIDMLNYGAAAQKKFGYNTSNLANAGTDEFQQHATKEYTITDKEWQFDRECFYAITVSLENTLELNTYFNEAKDGMYAKYSYTTHSGKQIEGRVEYGSFISGWNHLGIAVPVAIADADALVTVDLYNSDDAKVGTTVYSIDGYLKGMINQNEPGEIYEALAKFAASAKNAFVTK